MVIKSIKRPWANDSGHGTRLNRDPFYNSTAWRKTRKAFRQSTTLINGYSLSNTFCAECYRSKGILTPALNLDHIQRIKDGGDRLDWSNLQTLCDSCHAIKSANEGNKKKIPI